MSLKSVKVSVISKNCPLSMSIETSRRDFVPLMQEIVIMTRINLE